MLVRLASTVLRSYRNPRLQSHTAELLDLMGDGGGATRTTMQTPATNGLGDLLGGGMWREYPEYPGGSRSVVGLVSYRSLGARGRWALLSAIPDSPFPIPHSLIKMNAISYSSCLSPATIMGRGSLMKLFLLQIAA